MGVYVLSGDFILYYTQEKGRLWDCVARNNEMTPAWINHVGEACADTVPRCEGRRGAVSSLR
jgi:hypothetical protein